MVVWGILVQLLIGAATIVVAFRVGRRNADEAASATVQRDLAARREEWWRRMTYALNASTSDDPRQAAVGFRLLESLLESDLSTPDDRVLGRAASDAALIPLDPPVDRADTEQEPTGD